MKRTTNKADSRGLMILAACGLAGLGGSAPATAGATLRDVEISDVAALTDAIDPSIDSPLNDLLADWGEGSVHDLNCDGTVDVRDYLILISKGIPDSPDFLGMVEDWGQGSPYDLNCDGAVNIADFLQMLEEMAQATVQPVPVNEKVSALLENWGEGSVHDLNCDGIVDAGDFLLLVTRGEFDIEEYLGMLSEWGQGSPYDLNCDGVVDTHDFLAMLAELANEVTEAPKDAA